MMWFCSESDSDSDVIADDSEASFSDDNPDYINYQVSFNLLKMVIPYLIFGYYRKKGYIYINPKKYKKNLLSLISSSYIDFSLVSHV